MYLAGFRLCFWAPCSLLDDINQSRPMAPQGARRGAQQGSAGSLVMYVLYPLLAAEIP